MRGCDRASWPAGYEPRSGDAMAGSFCEGLLGTVVRGGGLFACRDSDDLNRLVAGWSSMTLDFASAPAVFAVGSEQMVRFLEDRERFQEWSEAMADSVWGFTTWSDEIAEFDGWTGTLKAWRDWYVKQTGGDKPSGDEPIPEPGAPGGILSALDKATTLVVVAGVAFVAVQLLKR